MKVRKHFLSGEGMYQLYLEYQKSLSYQIAAERAGVSYAQARKVVDDIQIVSGGGIISRRKGRKHIFYAVDKLKRDEIRSQHDKTLPISEPIAREVLPPPTVKTETSLEKMDRLYEALKEAIGEYALEVVKNKNRELVEAAKKSNFTGFVEDKLGSWLK